MICNTRRFCLVSFVGFVLVTAGICRAQTVINTLSDLQAMQSNLSGSYVLGGNIDASATSTANGGTGFIPVGTQSTPFTGTFDGNGYTISGLTINSTVINVGLFGHISGASVVQNVSLVNVSVTSLGSQASVGALVGQMDASTKVNQCSAQGTVTASNADYVGGLVGTSSGSLLYSQASVTVTSKSNGGSIGGLLGQSEDTGYYQNIYTYGNVQHSQANGNVSGMSSGGTQAYVGGLIGRNIISTVAYSRATGNVSGTGNSFVGGLIGQSGGWLNNCIENYCIDNRPQQAVGITYSFATGLVTVGSGGYAGGLIGDITDGYVYQDFASGNVTNNDGGGTEGGLIGENEGTTVEDSYATGGVADNSALSIGGLIGANVYYYYASKWQIPTVISSTYSVGPVQATYSTHAGGLVGQDTTGISGICSYWATDSSLQTRSADGAGVLLAQLENGTLPGCFDPTIWTDSSTALPTLIKNPAPAHGYLNPKFQVIGVTYAPPGPSSGTFVQYTTASSVGTSQTISQSFQNSNTVSVNLTFSYSTGGATSGGGFETGFKGSVDLGYSQTSSETVKNSSTVSTNFSVSQGEKTAGTGNYFFPVDHDYDLIWIWLNPTVILTVYPAGVAGSSALEAVEWNGYGFDTHDQSDVDVVGIPLGYLNGDFGPIPPEYQASFNRAWAAYQTYGPGQGAALTSAELAQIASADPFSVSSYGLNSITATPPAPNTLDNRFTLSECSGESGIPYLQANPSQSAETYTCSISNQNSSSTTHDVSTSYSQTYSIDATAEGDFTKAFFVKAELKDSWTLTWTTDQQNTSSSSTTIGASLSVQGPPCNNVVQGIGPCVPVYDSNGDQPTQFDVYQDNLYGTFMFAPVNYYTSTLNTTVSTPVFSPVAGTYGSKQTVTITDATPAATIFYTTNGTMPTTSSTLYSGPIAVGTNETIQAIAVAADLSNSNVASAAYTITNPQSVASPTFSLTSGSYSSAQTVAIADTTAGASIYYTVNGTTPTASSTPYTGPVVVNSSETIEAMAVAPGYAQSAVVSAAYTITGPAPNFEVSANPTAITITGGQSGTATISVTPSNGFATAVTLACSGLSAGMGCTFSPASITPNGTAATSTVTITTTASTSASLAPRIDRSALYCAMFLPGSAFLVLLSGSRRRRAFKTMFLAIVVLGTCVLGISSCGSTSRTNLPVAPGSATPLGTTAVTVVGLTSGVNGVTQSTSLAVTVMK